MEGGEAEEEEEEGGGRGTVPFFFSVLVKLLWENVCSLFVEQKDGQLAHKTHLRVNTWSEGDYRISVLGAPSLHTPTFGFTEAFRL